MIRTIFFGWHLLLLPAINSKYLNAVLPYPNGQFYHDQTTERQANTPSGGEGITTAGSLKGTGRYFNRTTHLL